MEHHRTRRATDFDVGIVFGLLVGLNIAWGLAYDAKDYFTKRQSKNEPSEDPFAMEKAKYQNGLRQAEDAFNRAMMHLKDCENYEAITLATFSFMIASAAKVEWADDIVALAGRAIYGLSFDFIPKPLLQKIVEIETNPQSFCGSLDRLKEHVPNEEWDDYVMSIINMLAISGIDVDVYYRSWQQSFKEAV